jgi:uncharacterized membrane protein YhaH (DUF805 family)
MDIVQLMFSFRGRINRKMFWLATLPLAVGYGITDVMTQSADQSIARLGFVIMIALVWPSLAVQTKRWHDRNRSGFWNLILFVPIVGAIWGMTELGFLPGTAGANLYGVPLGACPASDDGVPTPPAVNPYLANKLRESETVGSGSSMSNSWRGR